jgi:branched-chain amino acid transport system substrate-binding protein
MITLKKKWVSLLIILGITIGMVLWFANYRSQQTDEMHSTKLAAVLPLTGSPAQIGIWQKRGLDLAIEQINQKGGYKGTPLTITYEDSQGDPKTGVTAIQKILADSKPPVVFSSLSSVASATLPILDRSKTVSMLLAVSLPGITDRSPWAFRCNLGSDDEAIAMASYLSKTPIRRIAVAYINDEFGVGAESIFQKAAKNNNFEVTTSEAYNKDSSDFRTLITKLRSKNPEAIYVIGYVKASVLLVKQLRELNVTLPVLGNMALSVPSFLELGGKALDGTVFTVTQFDPNKQNLEVKSFVTAYKTKYKESPTFFSAFAYDSIMMIQQAANNRKFTSEDIRAGLLEIKNYPGVLGSLTVKPNRDIDFPTRVVKNKNGVLVSAEKDGI